MGKFNLNDFLKIQDKNIEEQKAQREENRMKKPAYKIAALHISDLVPSEENFYSMDGIEELKRDIELAGGVKQNLTVTPIDGGKYKILSGHRRYCACMELIRDGKTEYEFIPCGIEPKQENEEMQSIREELLLITTNSQREKTDWDKVQEAKHLRDVLHRYKSQGGKLPGRLREIIADTLNTSAAQIGRLDAIGKNLIPEFQEEIKEKRLGISTAYEISGLSEERQKEALEEYREKGSFSISDARQKKLYQQQQGGILDSAAGKQDMPPVIPAQQKEPATKKPASSSNDELSSINAQPPESETGRDVSAINAENFGTVRSNSTINSTKSGTVQETLGSLCAYCKAMDKAGDRSRDWGTDASTLEIVIARLKHEKE